jgi:hypothetical protein
MRDDLDGALRVLHSITATGGGGAGGQVRTATDKQGRGAARAGG